MKTATLRDLRNDFASLEAWLAEGETIRIEKRGKPVAFLSPAIPAASEPPIPKPDVRERLKKIWGDRCFSAEEVKAMREYELEGEDG